MKKNRKRKGSSLAWKKEWDNSGRMDVYEEPESSNKLIRRIFSPESDKRFTTVNGRPQYIPSQEYEQHRAKFKGNG